MALPDSRVGVLFENSKRSGRCAFVEPKHAAQPRATLNSLRLWLCHLRRRDQLVVESLMISLQVIVFHIFPQGAAKHGCTDGDELRQALTFYGSDESFGERIQIRGTGR